MILLLLAVTATFQPAAPTVGDPITIQFRQAVTLDPSTDYEVVSRQGTRVVVRTFKPQPFMLSGRTGNVVFRNLRVPVQSVLKPNDKLDPAPLKPPQPPAPPRTPWVAIGVAALIGTAAWTALALRARRRRPRIIEPELAPAERFRLTVEALRRDTAHRQRWAALADATRVFLASLSSHLGTELTTAEILPRLDHDHALIVAEVLRQGDLEKFSPWGPQLRAFDAVAENALKVIPAPAVEEAA